MIDVHSHYWRFPEHFTEAFRRQARKARGDLEVDLTVRWEDYEASAAGWTDGSYRREGGSSPACGCRTRR